MSWSRHRLATNLGFALAILLLSWVGWHVRRDSISARSSEQEVTHGYEVLEGLDALLVSLHQAETGQRAYIISGNDDYLTPYYHSATRIAGQLGQLRSLTADNAIQEKQLQIVAGITARRLGLLESGNLGTPGRWTGLRDRHSTERTGAALMDSAGSAVSDMQAIERTSCSRSVESEAPARRMELTITWASGLGLLLLATSAVLANWEIGGRLTAERGSGRPTRGWKNASPGSEPQELSEPEGLSP